MYENVLRCSTDVETVFGTQQAETWTDQQVIEGTFKPITLHKTMEDKTTVSRLHDQLTNRIGSKFGSGFDVDFVLDGMNDALDAAEVYTHPENNIAEVMKALMGGEAGAGGTLVDDAASTQTVFDVTAGQGARFPEGGACINAGELRPIADQTVDQLTVGMEFSVAPVDTSAVYNVAAFYLDEDAIGTDGQSLCFRFVGYEGEDQLLYWGCCGTFEVISTIDEGVRLSTSWRAADWDRVNSESLASISFVGAGELPAVIGRLMTATVGATAVTTLPSPDFKISPNLSIAPQKRLSEAGGGGIQTVGRWRMMKATPEITFFVPHDWTSFDEWMDLYSPSTGVTVRQEQQFLLQIGNTVRNAGAGTGTGVLGFYLPQCMFSDAVERTTGSDGIMGTRFTFRARERQTGSGDMARSALSVYLG